MGELQALLARVEASEPSAELDALIMVAAGAATEINPRSPTYVRRIYANGSDDVFSRSDRLTSSLDDIAALVARRLPHVERSTGRSPDGMVQARIGFPVRRGPHIAVHADRTDGWEAMALCAALLKALMAAPPPGGDGAGPGTGEGEG